MVSHEYAAAVTAIGGAVALVCKAITANVSREVRALADKSDKLEVRVSTLDHQHTQTVERVVRSEITIQSLKDTLDRVERTINDRFEDLKAHLSSR